MKIMIAAVLCLVCCGQPEQGEPGQRGPAGAEGATGEHGATGATGVAGAPGLSISRQFTYHVDTYSGAPDVGNEITGVYLGDVRLVLFSDQSAFVSTSGVFGDTRDVNGGGGGTVTLYSEFAHAFFLESDTAEQEAVFKLSVFAGARARYRINTNLTVPSFKATTDNDNNFGDNTDTAYTLTEVP